MATRISVVSSDYCRPNSIKLTIDADKGVTYFKDGIIFRFEGTSFIVRKHPVLHDFSGRPVLTLKKKRVTAHGRWEVFKYKSVDPGDLLFSVKRPSMWKPHKNNINLEVFLAGNTTEESVFDFKINACASQKSCDICAHGSPTILAKMTNKVEVEVQPNVDYAFIVALITIVHHEINHFGTDASEGKRNPLGGKCWGVNLGANVADMVMDMFDN